MVSTSGTGSCSKGERIYKLPEAYCLLFQSFFPHPVNVMFVSVADGKAVTCGSAIKLTHVESGGNYYLNSESAKMGSGSGQQIVSLHPKKNKSSSLWVIREANNDEICPPGEPIKCGQQVRLSHPDTEKNLHSHLVRSPLSRQQEVSGFGESMEGDTGDDWILVCGNSSDKVLERAKKFHLQHVDTRRYLAASSEYKFNQQNCGGGCPIMNHLEAHCRSSADKYTEFKVELGVHLSK